MTEKEKNYLIIKKQHTDQYEKVLTESLEQPEKLYSIIKIMLIKED